METVIYLIAFVLLIGSYIPHLAIVVAGFGDYPGTDLTALRVRTMSPSEYFELETEHITIMLWVLAHTALILLVLYYNWASFISWCFYLAWNFGISHQFYLTKYVGDLLE